MTDSTYMVGPGISFYRSDGDLSITFNATRPRVVDIELKLYDIFIPILGFLIITTNTVIVVSSGLILYKGPHPRATYIFLGNVALADLITGVAVIFGLYYPSASRTEVVCAVEIGMTVSASMASVYSIGLIGVDRFLYILYGLTYQRYIYPNRARFMVLCTWVLAIVIGFLPAMGYRQNTYNGKLCWFIIIEPPELVLITTTIGLVPLVLVIILYSIILYHALRKISQLKLAAKNRQGTDSGNLRMFRGGTQSSTLSVIPDNPGINGDLNCDEAPSRRCCGLCKRKSAKVQITPVYNPSKWKAIKIVVLTTGCFFVTWFPYFVASAMHAVCDPKQTPKFCDGLRVALASPLAILGLSNSLLNPIIYAWWHNGFRESLRKICRNCCGKEGFVCGAESSSTSQQTIRTQNTFLHKSKRKSDTEASDQESNPIMKSRPTYRRTFQQIGAQNFNYDGGTDEDLPPNRKIEVTAEVRLVEPSTVV